MSDNEKEERIKIELPPLPHGWHQLSAAEVEEVNRLMLQRQQRMEAVGRETAEMDFRLKCFLLFTRLKVLRRTARSQSGETVYLFRRRGLRHLLERIPMQSWQITQWIDQCLGWLEDPLRLFVCPYGVITIRGKRFKAPSDLMTDVTRLQYFTAQNLLSRYWECVGTAGELLRNGGTAEAVRAQMREAEQSKCRFLACLFTPESTEIEVRTDTSVRKVDRTIWAYDAQQIEDNERLFRRRADRLFPVMNQFFQSVQSYYANIFPDLFTSKGTGDNKNMLQMEVDTMNAIMKYAGFKSYADINNANAVFILGVLNNMSKEAKEIKQMNERIKRK